MPLLNQTRFGRFSRVFSKQSVHNGKATCDGFDQQAPRARTSFRTKNTRKWTNKMYKKTQIFGEKSIGEKSPYTNIGGRHVVSQDLTLSNKMCKCINFIRASHTCTQRRTCKYILQYAKHRMHFFATVPVWHISF